MPPIYFELIWTNDEYDKDVTVVVRIRNKYMASCYSYMLLESGKKFAEIRGAICGNKISICRMSKKYYKRICKYILPLLTLFKLLPFPSGIIPKIITYVNYNNCKINN